MIHIYSFGYKHRDPAKFAREAMIVDVRKFRNPHNVPSLRDKDGRHAKVADYVLKSPGVEELLQNIIAANPDYVCVGCYGGRHRSVAIAEALADRTRTAVTHLELGR